MKKRTALVAIFLAIATLLAGCQSKPSSAMLVETEASATATAFQTFVPSPSPNAAIAVTTTPVPAHTEINTLVPTASPTPAPTPAPTPEPTPEPTSTPEPTPEVDEFGLTQVQRNAFSMLYYLSITAEKIRSSRDNRLLLEDIYNALLNDINPSAIDEETQAQLDSMRNTIKELKRTGDKRARLQYLHNQQKAAAINEAIPDPLAILSMSNALDWKRLAVSSVLTLVESLNNYRSASQTADQEYLLNGWELDAEENNAILQNREDIFNYMVDIVRINKLDGRLTLNEESVERFVEICAVEGLQQKTMRLEAEEETYQLVGAYWLELANCYYENSNYQDSLECLDKYIQLSGDIFRKDYALAAFLPKAIVAAQQVYHEEEYITEVSRLADSLVANASSDDWSSRYFAAQVYLDLYAKTEEPRYIERAFDEAKNNVSNLIKNQTDLNSVYLNAVALIEPEKPDYRFMEKEEKETAEAEYNEEKARVKAFNTELTNKRKTELPSLYEPLILNYDLLLALAKEAQIKPEEKAELDKLLYEDGMVFLSKPIVNHYSFYKTSYDYNIILEKGLSGVRVSIPVELMTDQATVQVSITDKGETITFDDCNVTSVERNDNKSIETFIAYVSSKQLNAYVWSANSKVDITISYGGEIEPLVFNFQVAEYKTNWAFPDTVVFEEA